MSRAQWRSALVLLMAMIASPAVANDVVGLWWAEGGAAQVEIHPCPEGLCGRVVWLRSPLDEFGCPLRDEQNPDRALGSRELIGIELVRGLQRSDSDRTEWSGGEIYDPTSGRTYRAVATLDEHGRLHVRGYLGIRLLGRTTVWNRVQGAGSEAGAQCLAPLATREAANALRSPGPTGRR